MATTRAAASILAGWLIALGAIAGAAPTADAADGYTDTAATTYTLDVVHGVIKVAADIRITNRTASTTQTYPCIQYHYDYWYGYTPYSTTCSRTVRYYLNSTSVLIERAAANIRVTSSGGGVTLRKRAPDTYSRRLDIGYPKLFYGHSRTLHLTYTIPGGAPRSSNTTRAMHAYASFCVFPHGLDSGTVTVRMPAAFTTTVTGATLSARTSGNERIYTSGSITDPGSWYACLEGTNESGYAMNRLTAADGRPVVIESWPEDEAWTAAVRDDVQRDMPALTNLIGRPMRGTSPLVIKETITGNEYAGFYDRTTNTITVDEDFTQPNLVGHELAHVWFNRALFQDTWLSEGYAEWAGRTVDGSQPACERPTLSSGATQPALVTWQYLTPKSTDAERSVVSFEYDASCYVVTQVADAVGDPAMTTAMQALLDGRDPYAADPSAAPAATGTTGTTAAATNDGKAVTWQRWLDTVDELALVPAGASPTLASDLLLEYGATSDRATLTARTTARAAYHDLADKVGDWTIPEAVRAPLRAWNFTAAQGAVSAALPAWTITGRTDDTLDGVDARHGPVADTWAAARTTDDLEAAASLAQRQLDAATEVAAAKALLEAPRDVVQEIGLIGETIPDIGPAVDAVRTIDTGEASRVSSLITDTVERSRGEGQLRIAIVGAGLVALVVLLLVNWRLAIRRRRQAAVATATPTDPGAPS